MQYLLYSISDENLEGIQDGHGTLAKDLTSSRLSYELEKDTHTKDKSKSHALDKNSFQTEHNNRNINVS